MHQAKSGMDPRIFKWNGATGELRNLINDGKLVEEHQWSVVSKEEMEKYTVTTFIDKARFYLVKSPPDLVQSAEKIWFAAVYAVKELYLSCGGIDLKSHNALKHFCSFAIENSGLVLNDQETLWDHWCEAQKMHQDVYGSANFRKSQYTQIIYDVEAFVRKLAGFDRKKLWDAFEKTYIKGADPNVRIDNVVENIKLGGHDFKCFYNVLY